MRGNSVLFKERLAVEVVDEYGGAEAEEEVVAVELGVVNEEEVVVGDEEVVQEELL